MTIKQKITTNSVNKIFIISGPSGAGEDSVIEELQKKLNFNRIITTVTRSPRQNESQGNPYYFISVEEFKKLIAKNELIEWAVVYGDYRGCTKQEVTRLLKTGKPIFWKVDWQGVKTIKNFLPEAVSIFIAPPSYKILEKRLMKRGQDTVETIKQRKKFTKEWLNHKDVYDYIVINKEGKFDETIAKAEKIIQNELKP